MLPVAVVARAPWRVSPTPTQRKPSSIGDAMPEPGGQEGLIAGNLISPEIRTPNVEGFAPVMLNSSVSVETFARPIAVKRQPDPEEFEHPA